MSIARGSPHLSPANAIAIHSRFGYDQPLDYAALCETGAVSRRNAHAICYAFKSRLPDTVDDPSNTSAPSLLLQL